MGRLLGAVTELSARDGYGGLTVARVLDATGLSRATFYQYFANLKDCFLAAYRDHASRLLADADQRARQGDRELTGVDAMFALAERHPDIAAMLFREGLGAGPTALRQRQALLLGLERGLAGRAVALGTLVVPLHLVLGGISRYLGLQLASDPPGRHAQMQELLAALTVSSAGGSAVRAPAGPCLPARPAELPRAPRGSPRRERLLGAAAEAVWVKGYHAATVSDIIGAAGVSRRFFYSHFDCKRAAVVAAYEHGFARTIAAVTPAFFKPGTWPERVWHGSLAGARFFASEPAFAYLGLVECHALGPSHLCRVKETLQAFTMFLAQLQLHPLAVEDAITEAHPSASGPRASAIPELVAGLVFEAGFQACLLGPGVHLRAAHPLVAYLTLAPYTGSEAASALIADRLAEASR